MAGLLFARAGVKTLVLEKHGDFLRDFRGDTVHPSTLELMDELGLLDEFLERPHDEIRTLTGLRRRTRRSPSPISATCPREMPLRRDDAAMGLPRFRRRQGEALSGLLAAHERRGGRPARRKAGGSPASGSPTASEIRAAPAHHRRRRPQLRPAGRIRTCRCAISARRSTSSGSACPRARATIRETGGTFGTGQLHRP